MAANDYAKMARAFLLYLLEAYHSTNRGQMMYLRWLAIFHDFGETLEANLGRRCRHRILYPLRLGPLFPNDAEF